MTPDIAALAVQLLRDRPLVIYAAGGGAEAISLLQETPNCGKVLVDAGVPYSRQAVRDLVGRELQTTKLPDGRRVGGATSQEAAVQLAWAAWARACQLAPEPSAEALGQPIGAAVVCTLSGHPSSRTHEDVAWMAVRTGPSGSDIRICHVAWPMGQPSSRAEQSAQVGDMLLRFLLGQDPGNASTSMLLCQPPGRSLPPSRNADLLWRADQDDPEVVGALDPDKHYLLPGSFNPLHHGHVRLKIELDKLLNKRGIFQVSEVHPLKGAVDPRQILAVLNAVRVSADIILSPQCGMHLDKVRRFGLDIACGIDAVAHVSDEDCASIARMGRRFIVVERPGYALKPERAALLAALSFPRYGMNLDISSTKLRNT